VKDTEREEEEEREEEGGKEREREGRKEGRKGGRKEEEEEGTFKVRSPRPVSCPRKKSEEKLTVERLGKSG